MGADDARQPTRTDMIYRNDPIARLVVKLFGQHATLLGVVVALGGVVCVYLIPATNGTLLPRPGFDSAVSDIFSAIIWIVLIPIAASYYLRQLRDAPGLFKHLYENGVTGLDDAEFAKFMGDATKAYNWRGWFVIAATIFAVPWYLFLLSVTVSPHTWYYPSNLWPWCVYVAIEYVEIIAALMYFSRYVVTCVFLRRLLRNTRLRPALLHPDGLSGFGSVTHFVVQSLGLGGGVLIVFALESINTSRTVTHFGNSAGLVLFIVIAVLYATVVPYLLLYPLRETLNAIGEYKRDLQSLVSTHINAEVQHHVDAAIHASEQRDEEERLHTAEKLVVSLRTVGQTVQVLETLPTSLLELGTRSTQAIIVSTVVPPLIAVSLRVATDVWGFNVDAIIRSLGGFLTH